MADTAAHLVDRVLPEVPIRQWVLTLPYPLRYRCAWNARLTSEVLRCFLRSVFADYRRRARLLVGVRKGQCGSVSFLQRFGSALNLTPHFHALVLDGVYPGPSHAPGEFIALPAPSTDDVARVLAGTARRILRLLDRNRFASEDDPLARDDPLMALLGAASIRSRIATGPEAGEPCRRLGDQVDPSPEDEAGVEPLATAPPRCVRQGGMSLHADVGVPARDRRRLERLCRYVARPPLALGRLEALSDGRLAYRVKTPWRDGTTHVVMERRELLERLAPLIPPPRAHQVRYHGILAPCASGRDRVVLAGGGKAAWVEAVEDVGSARVHADSAPDQAENASAGEDAVDRAHDRQEEGAARVDPTRYEQPSERAAGREQPIARRIAWADLLRRVFEVDALQCPNCGGRMRLIAAITEPDVARRILECLGLPARAPPLGPGGPIERGVDPAAAMDRTSPIDQARGEVQADLGFDPGVEFDQTPGGPW